MKGSLGEADFDKAFVAEVLRQLRVRERERGREGVRWREEEREKDCIYMQVCLGLVFLFLVIYC